MSLKSCDLKKLPNYNSTKQAFSRVITRRYIESRVPLESAVFKP